MPNTSCLFGPAFSITGESYYSNTAVDFQVAFDNESDQTLVLAYEWYLDNTLMIGQNIQQLIGQIGCGTHTIGVRILSTDGWSGVKNLQFFTCKVPSVLQIYGPGSLYEGSSSDYYVLQFYTDGTSRDVTSQYTLTSTTGGTFNGNVFTATVDDTSGKSIVVTIGAVKDGVQEVTKQVTIKNTTAIVQVSLLIVGPDSVNEGTSAAYAVISTYSDGSQQDLTSGYSFSATVGTFAGNTLRIPVDSIPGNSRGATVSAAKSGAATLSKQITVNDTTPVVPVSTVITGPDTVNEGASAAYSVISTYSDGSQQDLTAGYTFSATVGTFAGNILSVPVDGTPGNSRGATVSAAKSGAATLSKQITIIDSAVQVSVQIVGPNTVNEGLSALYTVIATYSDGNTRDLTSEYRLSATEGTFAGNILTIPQDNINNNTRAGTVFADKRGTDTLSKQITIQDIVIKAGILVVDLFSTRDLNVIGLIDNAEVAVNHMAAYTGNNFVPSTLVPTDAFILASDYNPSGASWRFEFNMAKLVTYYPGTQDFVMYIKGRSTAGGPISGSYTARSNDAIITMQGSPGSYIPSVSGGHNLINSRPFSNTLAVKVNNGYNESDLTTIVKFIYHVGDDSVENSTS